MVKLKVKKKSIFWLFLSLFWILENLAPHSASAKIGMIIMLTSLGYYCIRHKRLNSNPVLNSYCMLIALQILYVMLGLAVKPDVTIDQIKTMMICWLCAVIIYTFLYHEGTEEKIGLFFVYTSLISLLTVMFLCRNSLFTGRMAHAYGEGAVSYYFLGKPVAISSNRIATYSCFGFFFALLQYAKEKKLRWLVYDAIFIVGVLLTGSRKGVFLLAAFWMIYELIIKKEGGILLKEIGIAAALLCFYITITKIPALRQVIGERLEALLINLFKGKAVAEGSIIARAQYAAYARAIIQDQFLFGNGLGWFKDVYGNVTENNYYEIIVGCGVLGLIINYSFIVNAAGKVYRYRRDPHCLAMGSILAVLLIMEWGSVVYLLKYMLIYKSVFYLVIKYKYKNRRRPEPDISEPEIIETDHGNQERRLTEFEKETTG